MTNQERTFLQWQGICVHDVEPPRWVQKQKAPPIDSLENEFDYVETRRAVYIALNPRFSVVAIGTQR